MATFIQIILLGQLNLQIYSFGISFYDGNTVTSTKTYSFACRSPYLGSTFVMA